MLGARKSPRFIWPAFALACCGPAEPPPATTAGDAVVTTPATAKPEPAAPTPSPWHYAPALAAAIPPGLNVEPVLEQADGLHGHARIVVAVTSAETTAEPQTRLEIWGFSQDNDKGLLTRNGSPLVLYRLTASPADAHWDVAGADALRREIAGPGNETFRPLGLPGEPAALWPELARLAAASVDADPPTRARSLATLTRGLDEPLLFTRLPELVRRLRGPALQLGPPVQLGPRRVKISGRDGETNIELELTRTQLGNQPGNEHGWMLTELRELAPQPSSAAAAPAAEPSPTAP